jgi:preprotein translocase subunit SecF
MSFLRRLYRGETNIDFIGPRRRWYIASAVMLVICIASIVFRGFHFGLEFAGGNQFLLPVKPDTSVSEVRSAVESKGVTVDLAQIVGTSGNQPKYLIRTPKLSNDQRTAALDAITTTGHVTAQDVASSEVSQSWGRAVTQRALYGLLAFLVLVSVYIWIRFEQKMAIAGLGALGHDLLLTAGVYSLIGFELTPATIVGLLTILGFSLYDTVVVFDKVDENSRGLLGSARQTYAEAANLAVNQTLMRSINTSLIALLPVAALLFVGAGILGVGTLKDLALVLFVGMATGAYSSLFLATPWLVDLKMLDPRYKLHAQRVLSRRAGEVATPTRRAAPRAGAAKSAAGKAGAAVAAKSGRSAGANLTKPEPTDEVTSDAARAALAGSAPRTGNAPRTGARPASRNAPRKRPTGKRR